MGKDMDMRDMSRYWAFPWLQATGLAGMAGLLLSVPLGLWTALGRASAGIETVRIARFHRQLSVAVLVLVALHVVLTTLDGMGDSWRTVLVPGSWARQGWPEATMGYNTGIFALYCMTLFAASFYLGGLRIGAERWRWLHRTMWLAYGLSVWHALILGLDVAYYAWVRPLLWTWQIPCIGLLLARSYRGFAAAIALRRLFVAAAWAMVGAACALGGVAIVLLVGSGRFDFVPTV
jgi:predicted ferric reductase